MRRSRDNSVDEDVPLHHKKPFGSGLKRKRVEFVRAAEPDNDIAATITNTTPSSSVGDLYASIVLANDKGKSASAPHTTGVRSHPEAGDQVQPLPAICTTCAVPITSTVEEHEASLTHQVHLPHSHPPSALDRSRMGLRALKSQGWDPDARRGLGRDGEGVRFPIKTRAKDDTLGVGAAVAEKKKKKQKPETEQAPRRLTGKELKASVAKERRRAEHLQQEIYGSVDVDSYMRRKMDE